MAKLDLNGEENFVIELLQKQKEVIQKNLKEEMDLSKVKISKIIQRLKKRTSKKEKNRT
jgi:uncharacterized membrane protein